MSKVKGDYTAKLNRLRQTVKELYVVIRRQKGRIQADGIILANALEDVQRWRRKYREVRRGFLGGVKLRVRAWRRGRKGKRNA